MSVTSETRTVLVSGERRTVPTTLWSRLTGPKPPVSFACNGCSYSPDYVLGKPIWPACAIHDWHYHDGGPDISQNRADVVFARNVYTCLRFYGAGRFLAVIAAAWRYAALTRLGKWAYKMRG